MNVRLDTPGKIYIPPPFSRNFRHAEGVQDCTITSVGGLDVFWDDPVHQLKYCTPNTL